MPLSVQIGRPASGFLSPTPKEANVAANEDGQSIVDPEAVIKQLKDENSSLKERITNVRELLSRELQIEQDKNKSLIERVSIRFASIVSFIYCLQLEDVEKQLDTTNKEQEAIIELFAEERQRRDQEVENLKNKLREASSTIQDLMEQLNAAQNCRKG
ncbi:hypothetical protein HU200_041744 [Digitaria exilis]|uniref:Uncharacterized protein n=1 Tax=Digitaria exilis TaxID=1010633 RepID=A0A835B768_9POAL|nr:hypothetical protein HU200_041744 [Digitaria exilis]